MAEVAMRVAKGRFAGKRYLVIGGGRGLGEAASKILAAGGGDVALTYASGREDAESVAANIRDWGASARAIAFDVHAPPSARPEALPDGWTPDALLYFASPLIAISPGAPWNAERFGEFCDIFVTGFARAAIAADDVFGARGLPLTFFYPSTVFLDTPPPGAAEYVAAKAAGESLCATLALARPHTRVLAPRLPRVLTDQTISAKRVTLATPLDVLAPLLTAEDGL
jgi:NAD(P)-dependent dehydrogenase (short-subunit alcohol dehydrogenase family)